MTTPRVTRPDIADDVGENRDRIRILEAIAPNVMWPSSYNLMDYADWGVGPVDFPVLQPGGGSSSWTTVVDNTRVGGFYIKNTVGAGAYLQDAAFARYVRLGPQYSAWGITTIMATGTNCGNVTFALQYVGDDVPDDPGVIDVGAGLFPGSTYPAPTFPVPPTDFFNNGDAPTISLYAGVGVNEQPWDGYSQFRLMGAPGTPITAVTTIHAGDVYPEFDGGPGWYCLLVYVNGKSVSSTDYRVEISQLKLNRYSADGFIA